MKAGEDIEFNPSERRVYEISGDIEGRFQYDFTKEDGGTRVSVVLEFEHPPSVLILPNRSQYEVNRGTSAIVPETAEPERSIFT